MRNTPAQRRTIEKTEAILSACEALLLEMPSEQITATMICDRAGVTRTSMYHFFPSKVEVYDALAARYYDELRARILESFNPSAESDYHLAWHGVASVYRSYFESNPAAMVLLLGKKGERQAIYPSEQTGEELARQVHELMTSRTNLGQRMQGPPPEPDFFQYVLDLLASLFSSSVRREGKISKSAADIAQQATMALLQSASKSDKSGHS